MDDIVDRLNMPHLDCSECGLTVKDIEQARDEIEALRARVKAGKGEGNAT